MASRLPQATLGTRAWAAYVQHIFKSRPEAFKGLIKWPHRLSILKGIRDEDPEGYTAFTEAWKLEHADPATRSAADLERQATVRATAAVARAALVSPAAAAAEVERQAVAEQRRLQTISLFAIRIEGTDEEAEAVLAHLGPGRIYVSFKKNTMLAFQAINRFSAKYGLTQSQAEQVLRE